MEQKKHLPLRIVNSILLFASLVFCVITMIKNPSDTSLYGTHPMTTIVDVLHILMLAFGVVYMLMNYSKSASVIYKAFFVVLYLSAFFDIVYLATLQRFAPAYLFVFNLISLSAITVLAAAKDLGKKNTMLLTAVFVLCRLALLINWTIHIPNYGTGAIGILSSTIANLLIALTTGVMVIGKYLDKAERGTK